MVSRSDLSKPQPSESGASAPSKRWWTVTVVGLDDAHHVWAVSRAQARYTSWKAANEAGYFTKRYGGFLAFMRASTVALSDDQGDPRTPEFGIAP